MRLFDVYQHPRHGLAAVKRGFSWAAFAAPPVWAATRGLGWATLLLMGASALCFDLSRWVAEYTGAPIFVLLALFSSLGALGWRAGTRADRWHAQTLEAEGFEKTHAVVARSRRQAISAVRHGHFGGTVMTAAN